MKQPILSLILTPAFIVTLTAAVAADPGKDESGHGKKHRGHRHAPAPQYHGGYGDLGWEVGGTITTDRGRFDVRVGKGGHGPYPGPHRGYDDRYRYDDDDYDHYDDDYEHDDDRDRYDDRYRYRDGYYVAPGPHVPEGHRPPPGSCKVWIPDVPPGQQGPPTDCSTAQHEAAYWGGYVIYGGPRH